MRPFSPEHMALMQRVAFAEANRPAPKTADAIERALGLSGYEAAAYERVANILKTAADRIAEELHLSLTEKASTLAGMIDGAEYHLHSELLHALVREGR